LYAPGDDAGKQHMTKILEELKILPHDCWHLMPMLSNTQTQEHDLRSSNLTEKLKDALTRGRQHFHCAMTMTTKSNMREQQEQPQPQTEGPTVFLGMDAPDSINVDEIADAMISCGGGGSNCNSNSTRIPTSTSTFKSGFNSDLHSDSDSASALSAHICPCADGGYGMLCVSHNCPAASIFENVQWSCATTLESQVKALQDCGSIQPKNIRVGTTLMHDVDEPEDVHDLAERLCMRMRMRLSQTQTQTPLPQLQLFQQYTWNTLLECGIIEKQKRLLAVMKMLDNDTSTNTPPDQDRYHYCVCRPR
jgi:hypothetical protein